MAEAIIPNNEDVDMFDHLTIHQTENQNMAPMSSPVKSFLRKIIHPPSQVPGYEGLPTNDVRSQIKMELRGVDIIKTPITSTGTDVKTELYNSIDMDYAILVPASMKIAYLPFIYVDKIGRWIQDVANVKYNNQYNTDRLCVDAMTWRPTYKSITGTLNATYFNNTGLVVAAQFIPQIGFRGTIAYMAETNFTLFKAFIKHKRDNNEIVIHQNKISDKIRKNFDEEDSDYEVISDYDSRCKRVTKFKEEFEANIPPYIRDRLIHEGVMTKNEVPLFSVQTSVQVIDFAGSPNPILPGSLSPVPSTDQLLQNSVRSYTDKAMEGVFAVNRLTTIDPKWRTSGILRPETENFGQYQCYWSVYLSPTQPVLYGFQSQTSQEGLTPTQIPTLLDHEWSQDMTWTWIIFKGLTANGGGGNRSNQLCALKTITGVEIQPSYNSPWAPMSEPGPKPDLNAMQEMMDIFYQQKDAMPARCNFWGELFGTLGSTVVSKLGPKVIGSIGGNLISKLKEHALNQGKTKNKTTKKNIKKVVKNDKKVVKADHQLNRKIDQLNEKLNAMVIKNKMVNRPKNQRVRRKKVFKANVKPKTTNVNEVD
jgi:hypothetical protein